MDGYQLGIVMLAIADMHRHCDHRGKCRQMTPEELDELADYGWHLPDLKGKLVEFLRGSSGGTCLGDRNADEYGESPTSRSPVVSVRDFLLRRVSCRCQSVQARQRYQSISRKRSCRSALVSQPSRTSPRRELVPLPCPSVGRTRGALRRGEVAGRLRQH